MRKLLWGCLLLSRQKVPLRITFIYLLMGGLWILLSDIILFALFPFAPQFVGFEILKGWFYILVTAGLLYGLINRAMQRLLQSQETLRVNEEKYRLLFEQANIAILIFDEAGHFIEVNACAEALTGYSRPELLALRFADLLPELLPRQASLSLSKLAEMGLAQSESLLVDEAGRQIWVEYTVTPGPPPYLQAILRDISERKQLEEQFRQAQKMEAVGQLAGGVAHDFNNLLTVINGYVDLLLANCLEETVDPAAMAKDLEHIRQAGERAAGLVRQLLIFSRKQVLQPTILNLNEVVLALEKMLRRLIGEDIEVTLHLAQALGQVKADRGQVEQMLLNLAVNSRDAMPVGGRLTIETANANLDRYEARQRPEVKPGFYVMLAVADTGMGMDQETLAHIFEPFFTTKEVGRGTGLGLATVQSIVKQGGGHISVHSEPSKGTSFKIYLPRSDEPDEPPPRLLRTSGKVTGSETILLVEDEDKLCHFIEKVLSQYGYNVLTAADGNEALHLFERRDPAVDLLLTDVILPGGINGRRLAEQLLQRRPQLKVLFISGYTDDAIIRQGLLKEEVALLQKPFSIAQLAEKVRQVLDTALVRDKLS